MTGENNASFAVVVDAARLAAARPVLEAATIDRRRELQTRWMPSFFPIIVLLCWLEFVAGLWTWLSGETSWWTNLCAAIGLTLGVALPLIGPDRFNDWWQPWSDRLARRAVGRRLARTAKSAPFTVEYRIVGDDLHLHSDRPKVDQRIAASNVDLVFRSDVVYLFFKRSNPTTCSGIVYVGDDQHRAALDAFLATHHVATCDAAEPRA